MLQLLSTLQVLGVKVQDNIRKRAQGDSGQTAAEYMGIIVIVAIIIAAIATSGIGSTLATDITTKISQIFGHS